MPTEQRLILQAALDAALQSSARVRVLEAGCGSASMVRMPPDAYVVGIDISPRQLERNTGLDEKILGDIQSYPIPEKAFDLIVCWDVLEHVERPDEAIRNLSRGLDDGGLLLLAMPNLGSLKGLVTKLTPYGFHVWMHRTVLRQPGAGLDGQGPFPTHMPPSMTLRAVLKLAHGCGLEVMHLSLTESRFQQELRRRLRVDGRPWQLICRAFRLMTLGRLSLDRTEIGMILRGPARSAAAPIPWSEPAREWSIPA
jgi:SAM-dependent methyltransferase